MATSRRPHCASLSHPYNPVADGPVVRVTPRFVYRHRMCPVCGLSTGIARVRKPE